MSLARVPWTVGTCLAVLGIALAVAGPERLRVIVAEFSPALLALLAVPLLLPLGTCDLWNFQPLTRITFEGVEFVLNVFGVEAIAEATKYVVSSNSFSIEIGSPCSGVEGFALTMLFFGCYFFAFKESLRFPNVWVLLPIGLLAKLGAERLCGSLRYLRLGTTVIRTRSDGISQLRGLANVLYFGLRNYWCLYLGACGFRRGR